MWEKSSKKCAYCGAHGKLTREHIIADFLYRESPDQKLGYNQRADRFMTWEAKLNDVCQACNNGPLSELDGYAAEFLKSIDYCKTYCSDANVRFAYDYDMLFRWLLKVSFNASRTTSEPSSALRECAPYILGCGKRPSAAFLAVEVVRDTPIPEREKRSLPGIARDWEFIPTKMFRVGPGILVPPRHHREELPGHVLRFVAINAWYFIFALVPHPAPRSSRCQLQRVFQELYPCATMLKPASQRAEVRVSTRTGLDAYRTQGLRVADQWRQYLAEHPDLQ